MSVLGNGGAGRVASGDGYAFLRMAICVGIGWVGRDREVRTELRSDVGE